MNAIGEMKQELKLKLKEHEDIKRFSTCSAPAFVLPAVDSGAYRSSPGLPPRKEVEKWTERVKKMPDKVGDEVETGLARMANKRVAVLEAREKEAGRRVWEPVKKTVVVLQLTGKEADRTVWDAKTMAAAPEETSGKAAGRMAWECGNLAFEQTELEPDFEIHGKPLATERYLHRSLLFEDSEEAWGKTTPQCLDTRPGGWVGDCPGLSSEARYNPLWSPCLPRGQLLHDDLAHRTGPSRHPPRLDSCPRFSSSRHRPTWASPATHPHRLFWQLNDRTVPSKALGREGGLEIHSS
jgi:hypothetical protein